jgi:hypothetical protein
MMKKLHPAIQAYVDLFELYTSDDPPGIPYAQDPVGRARLECEWQKRGIDVPENILDMFNWWVEIGGERTAKRLCAKWRKELEKRTP